MKLTTNPMSTAAAALVAVAIHRWWGLRYSRSVTQPKPSAPTTQNSSEWLMPRWKAKLSSSLRKYLPRTSMSGMVPATAPQTMARLPMRRPSTTSPTAAPNTICDSESIEQRSYYSARLLHCLGTTLPKKQNRIHKGIVVQTRLILHPEGSAQKKPRAGQNCCGSLRAPR